jgi:hypothetical protein
MAWLFNLLLLWGQKGWVAFVRLGQFFRLLRANWNIVQGRNKGRRGDVKKPGNLF